MREKEVEHQLRTDINKEDLLWDPTDTKNVEEAIETDRDDETPLHAKKPSTEDVPQDPPHLPPRPQVTLLTVLRAPVVHLQAAHHPHYPLKARNDYH